MLTCICFWVQGPTLPYLAPAYNGQQRPGPGHSPGPAPGCRAPPGRPHEALSLLSLLRHHWRGTAPPRPFDEGLAANLWTFFLAPKPHTYRWGTRRAPKPHLQVGAAQRTGGDGGPGHGHAPFRQEHEWG